MLAYFFFLWYFFLDLNAFLPTPPRFTRLSCALLKPVRSLRLLVWAPRSLPASSLLLALALPPAAGLRVCVSKQACFNIAGEHACAECGQVFACILFASGLGTASRGWSARAFQQTLSKGGLCQVLLVSRLVLAWPSLSPHPFCSGPWHCLLRLVCAYVSAKEACVKYCL